MRMANGQNIRDAELQAKQLVELISPVVRASPGRYIKSALEFPQELRFSAGGLEVEGT